MSKGFDRAESTSRKLGCECFVIQIVRSSRGNFDQCFYGAKLLLRRKWISQTEVDDFVLETIREKVQFKVINTVLTKQQQQKIQGVVDKIQGVVKLVNKGFDIYNRFNNRNKPISKVRTVQDDFFDFLNNTLEVGVEGVGDRFLLRARAEAV